MRRIAIVVVLGGCGGSGDGPERDDVTPVCDGAMQEDEGGVVDGPYDKDGDGYVDGNDADCRANYGANRLDCDDSDDAMHPDRSEVECNGLDDDCNSDTEDARDEDLDDSPSCDDCDDLDPSRFPGNTERCWDEIDNDCDQQVDPGCGPNYTGTFDITPMVDHECLVLGIPYINIAFSQVSVLWNPPYAAMAAVDSPQPGSLEGTIDPETGDFFFESYTILGTPFACDEFYRFFGTFTDEDTLTLSFAALYVGGACLRCEGYYEFHGMSGVRVADGTTF